MNIVILTASMLAAAALRGCAQEPIEVVVGVELSGRVVDGGAPPGTGVVAVIVELQRKDDTAKPRQCATAKDGAYAFKDVAPGSYVMRFTKNEFVRRPHPLATEIAKTPAVHKVADVLLFREQMDDKYAASTAQQLAARGKGGALRAEWRKFEVTLISLPAKAKVASHLVEVDAAAKEIPEIRAFANADPSKLQQLDEVWRKAWVRGEEASFEIVKGFFLEGKEQETMQFLVLDAMARAMVQDAALDRTKIEERFRKDLPAAGAQLQKRLSVYKDL